MVVAVREQDRGLGLVAVEVDRLTRSKALA